MVSSLDGFRARVARIPVHGIGLSVDVASPDLLELTQSLNRAGLRPDYLEIFKAPTRELARVRAALPDLLLAYHAEGLWLTQPDLCSRYPWTTAVDMIARHTAAIGASWANHECASKQLGGHAFGTYLPPLFTHAAASVTARHAALTQARLDEWYEQQGAPDAAPLLLLELPPLTYFGFGDLSVQDFFARLVEESSCGLVLDIGHLWTHWRYRERQRASSLEAFVAGFLEAFPLDRVVQIHLAGLGTADEEATSEPLPFWIDRHDAPVPGVLMDILHQVLAHPGLTNLKGIALEVDTKAIPLIVEEYARLRGEFAGKVRFGSNGQATFCTRVGGEWADEEELCTLYRAYVRVVSGLEPLATSPLAALAADVDREGLMRYTARYLPQEILSWGGDLAELFPAAWRTLTARGTTGVDFVRFWFRAPWPVTEAYDFFYIKLDRWVAFVKEVAPDLATQVAQEAETLRALHAELNDEPVEAATS